MRTSIDDLHTKVVVRRIGVGAAPFVWEIHATQAMAPVHVSPEHFRTMEAAYTAGQARLGELLSSHRVKQKKVPASQASALEISVKDVWQPDEDGPDEVDLDIASDVYDGPESSQDSQPDRFSGYV